MSKSSTTFESEVKNCYAYGKFAVDLLQRVASDHKMSFESLWTQYFPNLSHVKALKNSRHFVKQCDPRNMVAPAKSEYHFYLTEQSKAIQDKGETYDIAKHGKEIGNRWKALSEADRTTYHTLAEADRKRRDEELASIEERIKSGAVQDSPFRRSPRHRTGNVSALNMYVREMTQKIRESDPTLSNTLRMKRIHDQWKQLTEGEHGKYQALADQTNKANAEAKGAQAEAAAAASSAPAAVVVAAPAKGKAAPKAKAAAPAPVAEAPKAAAPAKGKAVKAEAAKVEATPAPVAEAPKAAAPAKGKAAKAEAAAPVAAPAATKAKVEKAVKPAKAK